MLQSVRIDTFIHFTGILVIMVLWFFTTILVPFSSVDPKASLTCQPSQWVKIHFYGLDLQKISTEKHLRWKNETLVRNGENDNFVSFKKSPQEPLKVERPYPNRVPGYPISIPIPVPGYWNMNYPGNTQFSISANFWEVWRAIVQSCADL